MSQRSLLAVRLANLLSFKKNGVELELQPLNLLIGVNGSGKSNLIEAFRILKSCTMDLSKPFLNTGGITEWLNKNSGSGKLKNEIIIECAMHSKDENIKHKNHIAHFLQIKLEHKVSVQEEYIYFSPDHLGKFFNVNHQDVTFSYHNSRYDLRIDRQIPMLDESGDIVDFDVETERIKASDLNSNQSILSQRNQRHFYPENYQFYDTYKNIAFFTEVEFGRNSKSRIQQDTALDSSFLFEDASNLALVLNELQNQPQVMRTIIERLKLFYPRVENIITRVQGGTVQIYFQEEGLVQTVPATRLSDGTLRYLCLLVILCHPTPPPLICIEEPELGMHPDIIPVIAELLIEASQRTQLVVTTHSSMLVSAIGETVPEAVVVCERDDEGTQMRRLDKEQLAPWLENYSLGDVWMKGLIGGTRW